MHHAAGHLALPAGALALLLVALPARAGTVVTNHVLSESGHAQSDVPITFGQVFKQGDVPRGATLKATLNGKPVRLQVDRKATNSDGSMRHAVLTVMVPSLAKNATLPLALSTSPAGNSADHHDHAVTLSQLLETSYDAGVSLKLHGKTYTADARKLLEKARHADDCKPWNRHCNLWLSGPLTSAWVVNGPVKSADGKPDANLRIFFAVRAYADASTHHVSHVRTDIIVENTWAYTPQAQPQYTATLTSGSARYTSPALTQYTATRWHHVLWWNQRKPGAYLRQNTQYIQHTKAVSRYMKLKPSQKFLADLRQTCAPLDHCDQTKHMHMAGAQAAIGPLPRWTSIYIVDPDVHALRWMLANTDALGAYSIHYRDQATGWPLSIRQHPNVTIVDWAHAHKKAAKSTGKGRRYAADLLPNCINNQLLHKCGHSWYSTRNPYTWDNAHQPAESYVPYMVTGSYYYMSELAFGASQNEVWSNESYRGYNKGLINRAHSQVRGKAWTLRNMANAAWLLPDDYPLKAEFTADVENSLQQWNKLYTDNPDANPLRALRSGVTYRMHDGHHEGGKPWNAIKPWMHNFLTWSTGHAAELGFAGADKFRDWLAAFEIGLMTDWQDQPRHGYCWLEASTYAIQVQDDAGHWLPDYAAVYAATFPKLQGLACNSPAMVKAISRQMHKKWKVGKMSGYPNSATGFPANYQIGLASAADSGLPKAHDAWNRFQSRSVKPKGRNGYDEFPNFALLPRSMSD